MFEDLSSSEEKSIRHLARAVMDQLANGRAADDIVRELHGNGWPIDEAQEFVEKLSQQSESSAESLEVRFPDLKPISFQPALFRINGIGLGLYGARDRDPETGTYVTTWCACFLFIPIFALAAYRVLPAGGGWHLLGKQPLSKFARFANVGVILLVLGVIGGVAWKSHTDNPEYIARQKLKSADQALAAGDLERAAQGYADVIRSHTIHADTARQQLATVLDSPALPSLPPSQVAAVVRTIAGVGGWKDQSARLFESGAGSVRRAAGSDVEGGVEILQALWPLDPGGALALLNELLDGPFQDLPAPAMRSVFVETLALGKPEADQQALAARALAWCQAQPDANLREALQVTDALQDLPQPPDALAAAVNSMLEQAVQQFPDDMDLVVRLAVALESGPAPDVARIRQLLWPHRDALGSSEAARILGQILSEEEQFDEAYPLLSNYLKPRLESLHAAEGAFRQAVERGEQQVIDRLQAGVADGFDYAQYNRLAEDAQRAMVQEYVGQQLREDSAIAAAQNELMKQAAVVPAAIDLGIVTLRRAQQMTDPEARRQELEKAEQTFLAVQGIAGDNDAYRLHVGQVYYWLGKHEEGKLQFDQLLENHSRSSEILMAVGAVLREIGAMSEARAHLEEAYSKATEDQQRFSAAQLRA